MSRWNSLVLVCLLVPVALATADDDVSGPLPEGIKLRARWGAAPVAPGVIRQKPTRITVHHTVNPARTDPAAVAKQLRGIQNFHQQDKHWPDIAYHLLIDGAGQVWQGRPMMYQGSSGTSYDLSNRALVSLIANFEVEDVNPEQWQSLVKTVAFLCRAYGIPSSAITMHRDHAVTDCPGKNLAPRVADGALRRAVEAELGLSPRYTGRRSP